MTRRSRNLVILMAAAVVLIPLLYAGYRLGSRVAQWRHLDATYAEEFPAPGAIAPELAGHKMLFKMKTGLAQDDSQICVGFNIVFAALEAGADVTILFDAGATADLHDNLDSTGVPLRLKKIIAAQMHAGLDEMPDDYGAYLELLHDRGAGVYANTAMLIVTGQRDIVQRGLDRYPFIMPATYARVAALEADADTISVY